jgi:hypothetical protein
LAVGKFVAYTFTAPELLSVRGNICAALTTDAAALSGIMSTTELDVISTFDIDCSCNPLTKDHDPVDSVAVATTGL